MKKLFVMLAATLMLAGCFEDKGNDFVGKWQDQDGETITVEKTGSGYQVVSKVRGMSMFDMNMMLKAESDTVLIESDTDKPRLKMEGDGLMVSYLRKQPSTLTRVQ